MHYYRHHIGDFLKDTGHLSNDQMGIYLRMLWKYYLDEKPLHNDCESIAFAMRSDEKTVASDPAPLLCFTGRWLAAQSMRQGDC